MASIYANLETKEVIGINDGKPHVEIFDGESITVTKNPKAAKPPGTEGVHSGRKVRAAMTDSGFEYYSSLFERLKAAEVRLKASEAVHEKCLDAKDYRGCVDSHLGTRSSSSGLSEYERRQLQLQREQLNQQKRAQDRQDRRDRAAMWRSLFDSFQPEPIKVPVPRTIRCQSNSLFNSITTTCTDY